MNRVLSRKLGIFLGGGGGGGGKLLPSSSLMDKLSYYKECILCRGSVGIIHQEISRF